MSTSADAAANSKKKEKPIGVEFTLGALAAVGAGTFTNPADVIKIRLQLQGELAARGAYKKVYKNTFHAAYLIAKHEGIFALQAGIVPALLFQVILNGTRLGTYNYAKAYGVTLDEKGNTAVFSTATVSGLAGCVGAVLGSPFYLIKTQLQARSAASSIAVGHQHNHSGTWSALRNLWKEGGMAALYRGWYANIPRVFIGSATQLTTFGLASDWLRKFDVFQGRPLTITFFSSLIGGICIAITMQPFDVLATRLYNQKASASGKGTLYNGLVDASIKVLRTEGLIGLYKGTFPSWMRIGPHTVLMLVFYEKLESLYEQLNM